MKLRTVLVLVLAGSMWQGSLVLASPASAAPVGEFTTFAPVLGGTYRRVAVGDSARIACASSLSGASGFKAQIAMNAAAVERLTPA